MRISNVCWRTRWGHTPFDSLLGMLESQKLLTFVFKIQCRREGNKKIIAFRRPENLWLLCYVYCSGYRDDRQKIKKTLPHHRPLLMVLFWQYWGKKEHLARAHIFFLIKVTYPWGTIYCNYQFYNVNPPPPPSRLRGTLKKSVCVWAEEGDLSNP